MSEVKTTRAWQDPDGDWWIEQDDGKWRCASVRQLAVVDDLQTLIDIYGEPRD